MVKDNDLSLAYFVNFGGQLYFRGGSSQLWKSDGTESGTVMIEDIYATFTQHVADGRKMDIALVDSLGGGRVWAGEDALKNGLVDQLGTIDDAIALAAKLAKVSDYGIEYYPKQKDWFTKIFFSHGSPRFT